MEDIQIIYEDNDIIAVNKPAGVLVHEACNMKHESKKVSSFKFQVSSIVDWLIKKYPEIKNVGEDKSRPGIVHRLDKDTSGVLLIAKNQKTFEYLKEQFKNRKIKKTYLALIYGSLKNNEGVIESAIAKSKKDFRKKAVHGELAGKIREAVTEYKVIKHLMLKNKKHQMLDSYTLVEAYPKTGRTHQIRVHFQSIGHPVVCDKLYGPKKQECHFGLSRHFLHAVSLEFDLPSGGRIKIEADLPEDLQNVLNVLNY